MATVEVECRLPAIVSALRWRWLQGKAELHQLGLIFGLVGLPCQVSDLHSSRENW